MKQLFMYVMGGLTVIGLSGWGLYMVGKALWSVITDWRLGKELDQLQSEVALRRDERQVSREKRLATDCEHDFTDTQGLPPGTCRICGIEQQRPTGLCDHRWKLNPGATPTSTCETCARVFNPFARPVVPTKNR